MPPSPPSSSSKTTLLPRPPARPSRTDPDLEITAELPVLDVAAFEAAASAVAHEFAGTTDTWIAPSPGGASAGHPTQQSQQERASQELANREVDDYLQGVGAATGLSSGMLSTAGPATAGASIAGLATPGLVIADLAVAGARSEPERQLEAADTRRVAAEQRADGLATELAEARAVALATQARVAELQRTLKQRDASSHAREAPQPDVEIAGARAVETLAARDRTIAVLQREVSDAQALAASYLEALQSAERRGSMVEELVSTLQNDIDERDARLKRLQNEHPELKSELAGRLAAIEKLEQEVGSFATVLAQRTAQLTEAERMVTELRQTNATLEEKAQAERNRFAAQADSLAAALTAATARAEASDAAARDAVSERNEHLVRLTASDARVQELQERAEDQQDTIRVLQADSNASVARAKELEADLRAAEDGIHRLEAELRTKTARLAELEKTNEEWRHTIEEARVAINDRDSLIQRLEEETTTSGVLREALRGSGMQQDERSPPDGAKRLLIRIDGESEIVHVLLGRKTSVGRTPDNDLQVDAKFISRHHAVILAGPVQTIIEDLNSTNGVLVNGRRVARQSLKDGDAVVIGKTRFRFAVRGTPEKN